MMAKFAEVSLYVNSNSSLFSLGGWKCFVLSPVLLLKQLIMKLMYSRYRLIKAKYTYPPNSGPPFESLRCPGPFHSLSILIPSTTLKERRGSILQMPAALW